MEFLIAYIKQRWRVILAFMLFCLIFLAAFALYHIPLKAILYPAALCGIISIFLVIFDLQEAFRKHDMLQRVRDLNDAALSDFPKPGSIDDADYQQIIHMLCEEHKQLDNQMSTRYQDMIDYYTVWVHQIKTPIASMRLHLQNEDSALSRKLSADLFRIEQYVEMVLVFLRLDSDFSDYVIREYELDNIVKQAIKKFSSEFISRKLRLEYEPLDIKVITDEKWLAFVIEQVISNALKYTHTGSIAISMEAPKTLCIRDTGIGIAPEDLPRIFQNGYTGYNGRSDKKASGIGLYLCKRICRNLRHDIIVTSTLDEGTTIRINLNQISLAAE